MSFWKPARLLGQKEKDAMPQFYSCSVCDAVYGTKVERNSHEKRCVKLNDPEAYQCPQCGATYKNRFDAESCMRAHEKAERAAFPPLPQWPADGGTAPAPPPAPALRSAVFFKDGKLDVTSAEAEAIMKFTDALIPGVYMKCTGCEKFKCVTDDITVTIKGVFCKECR